MNYSKTLAVQRVRNGKGIVALQPFAFGATICDIRGRVVTGATVWRYWDREPRLAENCFRCDADHYINPEGEIGAFANHSCNPNAGIHRIRGRLLLTAVRGIAVGEEITHDYATLLGADDIWTMRCNCGEPNCRKRITNVAGLPASVLRRYRRLGIIPGFILSTKNG